MSHGIYYTSAPEGIKRGTSGFCTVAASENIPKALWDRLETLSAYRHQFGAGGLPNPVSQAHWILNIAGKTHHVLSRICDSGVDHTQRTNAFAHHLVLEPAEIAAALGGPAWLLEQPGVMADRWDGQVGSLRPALLPRGDIFAASRVCHAWAAATGDAGWGGHLADLFAKAPTRPVCILFAPGQDLLPLLAEAIALLPPAARWNVTFNTYFTSMPTSATCLWRCCLAGTQAAQTGLRYAAGGLVLDLTDRSRLPALPEGLYTQMARTGQAAETPRPTAPRMTQPTLAELKNKAGIKTKPGSPTPVYDPQGDAEEWEAERRRERIFEAASPPEADTTSTPVGASPYDLKDTIPASDRGPVRLPSRIMRRAEDALEESEREAERAAQRRRKQVLLLFVGALGAIALGCALVFLASRNSAPPEIKGPSATYRSTRPVDSIPIQVVDTNPTTVTTVVATTQEPTTIVATTTAPTTIVTSQTKPEYALELEFTTALQKPMPKGITAMQWQPLAFPADKLDPQPVTGLRLLFFVPQMDPPPGGNAATAATTYAHKVLGTLTAEPDNTKMGVRIYWKSANALGSGVGRELLTIVLDRAKKQVEMQWTLEAKDNPATSFLFWTLQNSTLELQSARDKKQRLLMKPLALDPVDFTLDQPWPKDLPEMPRDVLITPAAVQPADWTAANITAPGDKYTQISFKKATSHTLDLQKYPYLEASFQLKFLPGSLDKTATVESTFAAAHKTTQNELSKANQLLVKATKDLEDKRPQVLALGGSLAELEQKQAEALNVVNAYAAALAAYNDLKEFDIVFDLPDKMRLATLHFQRTKTP